MLLNCFALIGLLVALGLVVLGELSLFVGLLAGIGTFVGLILLAVGFVWVLSLFVDPEQVQEADSPLVRWIVRLYAPAVFTLLRTKIEVTGLEKVPTQGRFVLVCNHLNSLDPGVLLWAFPKSQLGFISKKENLDIPIIGPMMLKVLCQPLDRENDRSALKVILRCIQLLKDDKASIGVFPEGYTSRDGHLQSFRNGVFKIPQKANVPIVVCTLHGTREIFSNLKRLRSSRVQLHVLEVIPPEELKGLHTNAIGDRIHSLMARDLGEEG